MSDTTDTDTTPDSGRYYVVKRRVGRDGWRLCGHHHRSEPELAKCWRKRGEIWFCISGEGVYPVTEPAQLARLRALVPRPSRGRPPLPAPLVAPASALHVVGINVDERAAYEAAGRARGYPTMSAYVRALLAADHANLLAAGQAGPGAGS